MGLAARGLRDMDTGVESIHDSSELIAVRRQARRVQLRSILLAAALTALYLAMSTGFLTED